MSMICDSVEGIHQSICFYFWLYSLEIKSKTNPTTAKPKSEVQLQGLGVDLESTVAGSKEAAFSTSVGAVGN